MCWFFYCHCFSDPHVSISTCRLDEQIVSIAARLRMSSAVVGETTELVITADDSVSSAASASESETDYDLMNNLRNSHIHLAVHICEHTLAGFVRRVQRSAFQHWRRLSRDWNTDSRRSTCNLISFLKFITKFQANDQDSGQRIYWLPFDRGWFGKVFIYHTINSCHHCIFFRDSKYLQEIIAESDLISVLQYCRCSKRFSIFWNSPNIYIVF